MCRRIYYKHRMSVFSEICPVGTKLFHIDREAGRQTDGRTDGPTEMTKLMFKWKVLLHGQAVVSPLIALFLCISLRCYKIL